MPISVHQPLTIGISRSARACAARADLLVRMMLGEIQLKRRVQASARIASVLDFIVSSMRFTSG